jgi:hypothetical protein
MLRDSTHVMSMAGYSTRRVGGDERIVSTMALASPDSPRRSHNLASSCAESILPGAHRRFRQHVIPGGRSTGSPFVKDSFSHRVALKRSSG